MVTHDITWLASEGDTLPNTTISRPLNLPAPKFICITNLFNALKEHMHSKHKLDHANPKTGYFSHSQNPININASWITLILFCKMKENNSITVGTFSNQKRAVCVETSTSLKCPLCHHSENALHVQSGCQHQTICMMLERHNIACRFSIKTIEAGSFGGCFVHMGILRMTAWHEYFTDPKRICRQKHPWKP